MKSDGAGKRSEVGSYAFSSEMRSAENKEDHSYDRVKVTVRIRPTIPGDQRAQNTHSLAIGSNGKDLTLHRLDGNVMSKDFHFDRVLTPSATQEDAYDAVAAGVVNGVLEGYNGAVLAYGQTGAGKTHTLLSVDPESVGLIPRAAAQLFVRSAQDTDCDYRITMSFMQIYMESIHDLLKLDLDSPTKLAIRDTGRGRMAVEGLHEEEVRSVEECLKLLEAGATNRAVAFSRLNATSSRSHALVTFTVRRWEREPAGGGGPEPGAAPSTASKMLVGKLFMVDLAGSERLKWSGSEGLRASEARSINLSLTVLGKCINERADGSFHVSYRNSKLTRVLKECLGGNSRTSLVCCVYPGGQYGEETGSTLQFGERATAVHLTAKKNLEALAAPAPPAPAAPLPLPALHHLSPKEARRVREAEAQEERERESARAMQQQVGGSKAGLQSTQLALQLERQRSTQLEEDLRRAHADHLQARRALTDRSEALQARLHELEAQVQADALVRPDDTWRERVALTEAATAARLQEVQHAAAQSLAESTQAKDAATQARADLRALQREAERLTAEIAMRQAMSEQLEAQNSELRAAGAAEAQELARMRSDTEADLQSQAHHHHLLFRQNNQIVEEKMQVAESKLKEASEYGKALKLSAQTCILRMQASRQRTWAAFVIQHRWRWLLHRRAGEARAEAEAEAARAKRGAVNTRKEAQAAIDKSKQEMNVAMGRMLVSSALRQMNSGVATSLNTFLVPKAHRYTV